MMTQFNSTRQPPGKVPLTTVLEIRLRAREGWTQGKLAREYHLSVGTIGRIVRMETHNKVAIVGALPTAAPAASELEASANRLLAFQSLLDQNGEAMAVDTDKLINEASKPPATVFRCDSCGIVEGGEHLESCQDASGGTLVRQ